MDFGWLTLAMSPSGDEDGERIDQLIEQVCTAESLGFSDVWLTEHYFSRERERVVVDTFAGEDVQGADRFCGRADAVPSSSAPGRAIGVTR